jgi:site-specific DNA-methyltransferase (adenine-specific)
MGKSWDAFVPPPALWDEALRVLKPGGHLLAFAGSRTQDLMGLSIRLAGFEIRDSVAWLTGAGFPKSLDVSKAIDKLDATEERRARALEFTAFIRESGLSSARIDAITGTNMGGHFTTAASQPAIATADLFNMLRPHLPEVPARIEELVAARTVESKNMAARAVLSTETRYNEPSGIVGVGQGERTLFERKITAAHTPEAELWSGWGTALKPAHEPVVVARKPLVGTVAANVQRYGTGALNIDATRIGLDGEKPPTGSGNDLGYHGGGQGTGGNATPAAGRWPANVVLDETTAPLLDQQSGTLKTGGAVRKNNNGPNTIGLGLGPISKTSHSDEGGASRFFKVAEPDVPFLYAAKAPKRERPVVDGVAHSTVKPLSIMRWLVKLVTPPGGVVLEPFAGSGTTVEACLLEGFNCIAVEREAEYLPLIMHRVDRQAGALPKAA